MPELKRQVTIDAPSEQVQGALQPAVIHWWQNIREPSKEETRSGTDFLDTFLFGFNTASNMATARNTDAKHPQPLKFPRRSRAEVNLPTQSESSLQVDVEQQPVTQQSRIIVTGRSHNEFFFPGNHRYMVSQMESLANFLSESVLDFRPSTDTQGSSSRMSLSDELDRLAQLKREGIITEDEFAAAKKTLLQPGAP